METSVHQNLVVELIPTAKHVGKHIDEFNLINMPARRSFSEGGNGRIYDPILCRFLSPDPYVNNPGFSQDYNRYSYVLNNPLMYTDPSGYFKWKWTYLIPGFGVVQALADMTGVSDIVKENKEFFIPVYGPAIWAKNNPQKAADAAALLLNPFNRIAKLVSVVEAINNKDWSCLDPFLPGTKMNNSNRLFEG